MGQIVEEVKLWNTPAVGAYLLWQFTAGYCNNHPSGDAPIGLLHFVATAILTSSTLSLPISNRRADLQSYARSFEESKNSDILIGIQSRIKLKAKYTLECIDIAVAEGLIVWDTENGKLYPRKLNKIPKKENRLYIDLKSDGNKAEILGKWFACHDLRTIGTYLKITF